MIKTSVTTTVLLMLALALLPASAAAERPPMQACGDIAAADGLLIADVTARRVSCREARRVARMTPERCGDDSCTVRGFTCLVGRATEELRFARCTKPRGPYELYRTIRFDFGS